MYYLLVSVIHKFDTHTKRTVPSPCTFLQFIDINEAFRCQQWNFAVLGSCTSKNPKSKPIIIDDGANTRFGGRWSTRSQVSWVAVNSRKFADTDYCLIRMLKCIMFERIREIETSCVKSIVFDSKTRKRWLGWEISDCTYYQPIRTLIVPSSYANYLTNQYLQACRTFYWIESSD